MDVENGRVMMREISRVWSVLKHVRNLFLFMLVLSVVCGWLFLFIVLFNVFVIKWDNEAAPADYLWTASVFKRVLTVILVKLKGRNCSLLGRSLNILTISLVDPN